MNEEDKKIDSGEIKKHLDEIERHITSVRQLLFSSDNIVGREDLFTSPDGKIVEGVFNGESMVDQDGKIYPVSPNYASKSQLVVGDKLKLTIAPDGRFMYKQIGPIDRKRLVCKLSKTGAQYWAECKGKKFRLLLASVTYFKADVGDKLTIVIPSKLGADWAAVENVVNNDANEEE